MIKMKESNSPYLVHLNSYKTTPSITKQHCCQATKIKLRPILFNCPNGAVYERTIKLAKKCTCVQCDWIANREWLLYNNKFKLIKALWPFNTNGHRLNIYFKSKETNAFVIIFCYIINYLNIFVLT